MRTAIKYIVVTLVLFAAAAGVYAYTLTPPYWTKTFGQLDERFYFGPQAYFLDVSLKKGEYPLWNPLSYCGMPFAADPQASACYPPHLIRSWITPANNPYATAVSLHILRFLHLLWAGLGMVLLARRYKLSMPAALVGAFAFMFNAFNIIYFTEFYVYPLVIVWAPWVLWAAKSAFVAQKTSEKAAYGALTALCFGISTLGGFPQLSLYLGLMLAFFGTLDILFTYPWKLRCSVCMSGLYAALLRMAFLLVIAVAVMLAANVLLLPAFELGASSARVVASGVKVDTVTQDFHWLHLLKCLLIFPGNTWLPLGPRAAGVGSLLLALVALFNKRCRDAWLFFFLYLILTDCTLGPPFPIGGILHRFDTLNITVSPWRAGSFASLPFAMLAALGVDAVGRVPVRYWQRFLRMLMLLGAGIAMLTMLYFWLHAKLLHPRWYLVWHLPLGALLAVCVFSWLSKPRLAQWITAILVSAEIIAWSAQMLPVYVSKRVSNNMDVRGFGEQTEIPCDNRRYGDIRPNWNLFTMNFTLGGYNPLYVGASRTAICRNGYETYYRGYLKCEDVLVENQRGNLLVKRSFWLARQWAAGMLPGKEEVFPATTTVFLPDMPSGTPLPIPEINRADVPRKAVSDTVERVDLGRLDIIKPRRLGENLRLPLPSFEQEHRHSALSLEYVATGTVDIRPICQDETGRTHLLKRIRAANTRGKSQFLEAPLPDCQTGAVTLVWKSADAAKIQWKHAHVLKDMEDEDDRIAIQRWTANRVSLTVNDLPGPRMLLFLDSYYPGWKARVNGEETSIFRANDAFKAILLPAGSHAVEFSYHSSKTSLGLAISTTTFFVLLLIIVMAIIRMKGKHPEFSP